MNLTSGDILLLRRDLTAFWDMLYKWNESVTEKMYSTLWTMRKYRENPALLQLLRSKQLVYITSLSVIMQKHSKELERFKTKDFWGLLRKDGSSGLNGRWVIPIRDFNGNISAVVGWYPCDTKYFVSPTLGFSRETQFFGTEDFEDYVDAVQTYNAYEPLYVVEGIFDTLAVKSLGLHCVGNMGLSMSAVKKAVLERYRRIIFVPDGDDAGRTVMPHSYSLNSGKKRNFFEVSDICANGSADSWSCNLSDKCVSYLELGGAGKVDLDFLINQTDLDFFDIKAALYNLPLGQKVHKLTYVP